MQKKIEEWTKYFKDLEAWLYYKNDKNNKAILADFFPAEIRVSVYNPLTPMKYDTGWVRLPSSNAINIRHLLSANLDDLLVKVYVSCGGQHYSVFNETYYLMQKSPDEITVRLLELPTEVNKWNKIKVPKAIKNKWKNLENLTKTSAKNSSKLRNLLIPR